MYKQLYHALNGYTTDNDEYIIKHQLVKDPAGFTDYWGGYLGYLGYIAPQGTTSATNFNQVAKSYLVCSTADGMGSAGRYSGYKIAYGKAINKHIAAEYNKTNKKVFINHSKKVMPSKLPYVGEARRYWYTAWNEERDKMWTFVHNKTANYLFLDGHAAAVGKERAYSSAENSWYYGTGTALE